MLQVTAYNLESLKELLDDIPHMADLIAYVDPISRF